MNRLCLDTSAYSHFKRGHEPAIETIAAARWIGVPAIVLGELRYGFLRGARPAENERELQEFLNHPAVEYLAVDNEASRHYADIVVSLHRAGTPIPTNDIWIAAVAARESAVVLTYDEHFTLVERIGAQVLTRSG